jgi:diamine N-acetyltransferase
LRYYDSTMNEPFPFDLSRFRPRTLLPMNPDCAVLFGAYLAGIDPWLRLGYSPAGLARYLSANAQGRQALAVLDGETPSACFTVRPGWLRGPLLELLAVLPQHQGKGLGKEIILWLAEEIRCQGQSNLWTISSEFNVSARAFYRRQGFEEAGELSDLIRLGESEILLRLRLLSSEKQA